MNRYHDREAAQAYAEATRELDLSDLRARFLTELPERPPHTIRILDLGCGPGRDARAFSERGYGVEAMDPSPTMAELTRDYSGVPVRVLRVQDLAEEGAYDGVWACASLLHVPWAELPAAFQRIARALRPGGVLYASFKLGDDERSVAGEHFTDLNKDRLRDRTRGISTLRIVEIWETSDVRSERSGERWLNALLRRVSG